MDKCSQKAGDAGGRAARAAVIFLFIFLSLILFCFVEVIVSSCFRASRDTYYSFFLSPHFPSSNQLHKKCGQGEAFPVCALSRGETYYFTRRWLVNSTASGSVTSLWVRLNRLFIFFQDPSHDYTLVALQQQEPKHAIYVYIPFVVDTEVVCVCVCWSFVHHGPHFSKARVSFSLVDHQNRKAWNRRLTYSRRAK